MPSEAFLHYLEAPEVDHADDYFRAPGLPSKINESFLVRPTIGWGVEILEGPNWARFWTVMAFATLISGLAAGLFAWLVHDRATAVAIGAWLTALQAMVMTAMFFIWR